MITGGVYNDTTFTTVVPGTEEQYGPFERCEDAVNVWRGKMGRMIDTCEHRLFVVETGPDLDSLDAAHADAMTIRDLADSLIAINKAIFAHPSIVGTPTYFKIRGLCVDTLKRHDLMPPSPIAPL